MMMMMMMMMIRPEDDALSLARALSVHGVDEFVFRAGGVVVVRAGANGGRAPGRPVGASASSRETRHLRATRRGIPQSSIGADVRYDV